MVPFFPCLVLMWLDIVSAAAFWLRIYKCAMCDNPFCRIAVMFCNRDSLFLVLLQHHVLIELLSIVYAQLRWRKLEMGWSSQIFVIVGITHVYKSFWLHLPCSKPSNGSIQCKFICKQYCIHRVFCLNFLVLKTLSSKHQKKFDSC